MDINSEFETGSRNPENLLQIAPDYELFSLNQLAFASFLGGPFAGFYMIYYNLRKLELTNRIWRAAAIIFGVLLLSFLPDILGVEDVLPGLVYSLAYTFSTYLAGRYVMDYAVQDHEQSGGSFFGNGRVALVIFINIIALIAVVVVGLILIDIEGFKAFLNE